MFSNRKPALRHFAVIERASRSVWGSLWLVQDRRNLSRKQYLFVPSRLRAWPRWLKLLELQHASPTRLRNGRVALLINDEDLEVVIKTVKSNRTTSKAQLDALRGFQETKTQRKKLRYGVAVASLVAMAVLLIPRGDGRLEVAQPMKIAEVKVDSCSKVIEAGVAIEGASKKLSKVLIAGAQFKIADVNRFGGLAQLKIKRLCDSKYFRVDAWASGKKLLIEKIY